MATHFSAKLCSCERGFERIAKGFQELFNVELQRKLHFVKRQFTQTFKSLLGPFRFVQGGGGLREGLHNGTYEMCFPNGLIKNACLAGTKTKAACKMDFFHREE